ncbi:MAG: ABC transporter ATP-binding protein [Betaproteobacteria bacterium]|nr:ABC transporter ATP-binding protein [Betaproteobacteria bacterium]
MCLTRGWRASLVMALLTIDHLRTEFASRQGALPAVDDLSLHLNAGEVLGLVGESGSGKSVTGFSVMGLIDPPGRIAAGSIRFEGAELVGAPEESLRQLRGNRLAMVFQDPMMTLNPVLRIDTQMVETLHAHRSMSDANALARCREVLLQVGITSPDERLRQYPHQFSGGMRQRVAIAIALLLRPALIIADEPTTALDVTIQGQILYEMQRLKRETGTALLWITHDLSVIAGLADRVAVMYAGRIVEQGPVDQVLDAPLHPYTRGLIDSVPANNQRGQALHQIPGMTPSLLNRPAGCVFRDRCPQAGSVRSHTVHALDSVSFTVAPGEVVGLVGESGCGKSTLGRIICGLNAPTEGEVLLRGVPVRTTPGQRPALQMVFQDPFASLNPRKRIGEALVEAPIAHGLIKAQDGADRAAHLLGQVGLDPSFARRYPHQFSGGQRARIGIARALAVQPDFLVCDEAVAALDVSVQAQILNLFMELRQRLSLTYLFISHDLGVVRHLSDRIVVMYLGRVVEVGATAELMEQPRHPYTRALLAEIPRLDRRRRDYMPIKGEIPSPLKPPSGCHFHPRCPNATPLCAVQAPQLRETSPGQWSACHLND